MAWITSKDADVWPYGWTAFRWSTALSNTGETIKAAPGAGLSLYIEMIFIQSSDAGPPRRITIGEGLALGTVTNPFFQLNLSATSGAPMIRHFERPVKLTANTALAIDVSFTGGDTTVIVQGYTK